LGRKATAWAGHITLKIKKYEEKKNYKNKKKKKKKIQNIKLKKEKN
jgi:hypothetical protein